LLTPISTCAISIIRLHFLGQNSDVTFESVTVTSWSLGELGCGIVCVCLPTLRPLISKYLPTVWTEREIRSISGVGRNDALELSLGDGGASSGLESADITVQEVEDVRFTTDSEEG
jgi:hypothetical protein